MRRIVSAVVCGTVLWAGAALAQKAPAAKKAAVKKAVAAKPVKEPKFGMQVKNDDVIFYTQGNFYIVQAESINSGGNMLYFAAKDFTSGKDLIVKKMQKNEVRVDGPDRKVVKTTFLLGDANGVDKAYSLDLFTEVRKAMPFLATYTKFYYNGQETHSCGINWGVSCAYAKNKYKYYTLPKEGKVQTFKLGGEGDKKIGQAKWLYAHDGKGSGAGLICPAVILGKGEDFVFVNSVPPQKELAPGQSMDAFIIFMPIAKPINFKVLNTLYSQIANISWKFE